MRALLDRVRARADAARRRWPLVDHFVRMFQHYGGVEGGLLAGAITYYGFLSFFPVLALAFGVIGYVARVYPDARDTLVTALESLFPGLVGEGDGVVISLQTFSDAAATAGLVGAAALLYTGLGWISALRSSLQEVFCVPEYEQRNFAVGKGVDLLALVAIGVVLLVSVALSGAVSTATEGTLGFLGLTGVPGMGLLVSAVGAVLAIGASTLMFFTMFRILLVPHVPRIALVKGALLAALGFEVLKRLAYLLIDQMTDNPATAILGTSLVLLVWINYSSRVAMYGAAWAYTSPEARAALTEPGLVTYQELPPGHPATRRRSWLVSAVTAAAAIGLALARGRRRTG